MREHEAKVRRRRAVLAFGRLAQKGRPTRLVPRVPSLPQEAPRPEVRRSPRGLRAAPALGLGLEHADLAFSLASVACGIPLNRREPHLLRLVRGEGRGVSD